MKALIFENKVVDVQENEFEVHPSMTWVDCDNTVKAGFGYDGSTFTSNEPTAEEVQAKIDAKEAKATLKESAKAKLIAGEALTEDEANTIVL
tara:strand:+ start:460 stop:735 length:276 start_codon:yes stop_codon:yes gene_type:complete